MEELGVGTDIVRVDRFSSLDEAVLKRAFHPEEREYCKGKARPEECLAGRFAAKEAVVKALFACGVKKELNEIVIRPKKGGPPQVNIDGFSVSLSISHEREYAVATAVVRRHDHG
ncbi:MAG: holo-ACP synthase [Nanoarchaeota archaeon]